MQRPRRACTLVLISTALVAGGLASPVAATPSTASTSTTSSAIQRVVTLGDSYSSGSGIHRHASQYEDHGPDAHAFDPSTRLGASACYRHLSGTPGTRLAEELGATSTMVACAGAVIGEIDNQLDAARIVGSGRGTLIHLTIGGNDVRSHRDEDWARVVERCIKDFGCDRDPNTIANLDAIEDELAATYTMIARRHPDARVRVLAYPRLMQPGRWTCLGVPGVSRAEARFIDRQADDLNATIERAVTRVSSSVRIDLEFVPVLDVFSNKGACRGRSGDRYVNTTQFGQSYKRRMVAGVVTHHFQDDLVNFSTASFHPSRKGYDAYFSALRASL